MSKMKQKPYKKPAVKMLDTRSDVIMFVPGGGSLPSNPDTPGVNHAPAVEEEPDYNVITYHYSVWDD